MERLYCVILIAAFCAQQTLADCVPGTSVGPCMCLEDTNGGIALDCIEVTDGAEITAALELIAEPTLTSLDIRNSPDLTLMPDDAFGTTAVINLRFFNTGLQSLSASVYGTATSSALLSLYIKYCPDFTDLDSDMIGSLTALEELYVSSTSLTALTNPLTAPTLRYIDLNRNNIAQISDNYFGGASSLAVVLLAFNALTSSALANTTQSFMAPNQDLYLDFGYNELNEGLLNINWPDAVPRELILSGNGITQLTSEAFSGLMEALATQYSDLEPYILMDNNPLECGCEVAWVTSDPNRDVIKNAMCSNGQLLENLVPADFTDC